MWISLYAGFLLALPVVLYQVWAFFAPAFDAATQRVVVALDRVRVGSRGRRARVRLLRRAAAPRSHFLTNYDSNIYTSRSRRRPTSPSRRSSSSRSRSSSRCRSSFSASCGSGILSSAKLRRNRRIGYVTMAAIAVGASRCRSGHDDDGDDPADAALRGLDLARPSSSSARVSQAPRDATLSGRWLAQQSRRSSRRRRRRRLRSRPRRSGRRRHAAGGNPNQQLFFIRMRRKAKSVYVILAVLFGDHVRVPRRRLGHERRPRPALLGPEHLLEQRHLGLEGAEGDQGASELGRRATATSRRPTRRRTTRRTRSRRCSSTRSRSRRTRRPGASSAGCS